MGDSDQVQVRLNSEPAAAAAGIDRRALAAAAITVVLWASAFVAIRSGGRYFDAGALALGRLLAGGVGAVVTAVAAAEVTGSGRTATAPVPDAEPRRYFVRH